MRFARSGTNWEGRNWVVNDAVHFLATQIEAAWPERHAVDGTVASRQHDTDNPNSDHRPYPFNGSGVVYALDMGEVTEDDGAILSEQLRRARDPRLKYVIHEGRIFASYTTASRPAWTWGPYTGYNSHTNHVHVSVNRTAGAGTWNVRLGEDMVDHAHKPMPNELPRSWADASWDKWVKRSGTLPDTRGDTFYREDLSWVYERVIVPLENRMAALERESSLQAKEIDGLRARVAQLEGQSGAGPHNHDSRYPRLGKAYTIS